MENETKQLLRASLRSDFASFAQHSFQTINPGTNFLFNWHQEAIAYRLEQCRSREINRLMITMPPRAGKSQWVSVAFPAFLLGHDPSTHILNASYGHDLAVEFASQFRQVVRSPWYRKTFPGVRAVKDTDNEFKTTKSGSRFATSVGGTITGFGGDYIIIDDPQKPEDAMSKAEQERVWHWYTETLSTRLNDKKNGVIILVMQRLHQDDLAGRLLEAEADRWVHLNLPAIAEEAEDIPIGKSQSHRRMVGDVLHPQREPIEILEQQKKTMGSMAFSAQYQQQPQPIEGNLVKREWFRSYSALPRRARGTRIVQSWDTAAKTGASNDYSVCTTWLVQKKNYYLMDVFRRRLEYPELKKWVYRLEREFKPESVLIEDCGHGAALIQDLRSEGNLLPIKIKPERDKVTRMSAQSAKFEARQVWLPQDAHWLDEFIAELLAFPTGRHDDQVDSVSQFLEWISKRARMETVPEAPIVFTGPGILEDYSELDRERAQHEYYLKVVKPGLLMECEPDPYSDFGFRDW